MGISFSSKDITSRKQIEAEREQMIDELLKSNADLKQFFPITSQIIALGVNMDIQSEVDFGTTFNQIV